MNDMKIVMAVLLFGLLAGCGTVRPSGVFVRTSDENEFFVEFHPELANQLMIQKAAQDHCRKYGKTAHILEGDIGGLWTTKVKYNCLTEIQVKDLGLK